MSCQVPMLQAPHFTYDVLPSQSRLTSAVVSAYNEVSVADRVVRACAWTDNSADFVFGDGTVLSFCDEMQTFVAFPPLVPALRGPQGVRGSSGHIDARNKGDMDIADSASEGDYFFTPLTLSKYETKVREALHIYNYYSPRPRVVTGLTATPCEVWRQSSPIDSLVIAADRNLFERHGSRATLWCALRRVSLTLHGGRVTFSVRWPARAVERNMARSIFVRPVDMHGFSTGSLESVRSFHYVWVEQTFPVLDPPEPWAEMLDIALQLDADPAAKGVVEGADGDASRGEGQHADECRMLYRTTPCTAQNRQPCRFSKMKREHVDSLIAISQMQNATCNRLIRGPSERVVWRYDADPMGRVPHAVYWCLFVRNAATAAAQSPAVANSGVSASPAERWVPRPAPGSVLAMVREDESSVVAEPQGQSYVVHHWRRDGTYHQYHQSPDGELGLPPVIPQRCNGGTETQPGEESGETRHGDNVANNNSSNNPALSVLASENTGGMVTLRSATAPLYFSGVLEEAPLSALHRGRYLPEVGASCIQLSQLNFKSLRAQQQETLGNIASVAAGIHVMGTAGVSIGGGTLAANAEATASAESVEQRNQMRFVSNDPALAVAAAEGNVVFLTSSIDAVGTFVALTNGTIRCHFDDRTILFLIPGVDDSEEKLVATCLFRDATQCSMRLVNCAPHHPMYRYVAHALQFRRFARLSPETRTAVVDETSALKLQYLNETEWHREQKMEWELQQLLSRTEALLSGSEELSRLNYSLLHEKKDAPSAYFA
ncbi:hypothetical protein TraAM80_04213 [Trypanosoma rangeli]|uniref:C5orf34-like C-terminal domain-containing protein n=1 Tax=Trypanosoma rangeli TaxID=5698 RepID=A0A3R7KGA0_TRYRA|nr:uncharacterized protein TraAM80_04213 [Trypanosoma rangeli]RNF05914.1 hypothetical protein TraAM80_04213 [Trypanosoma rangeli]|eukprot:RNF05914.1 hypothetical protein TraAM80_04213 [Trypanosoma rangeli]